MLKDPRTEKKATATIDTALLPANCDRLKKQIQFLLEVDKLKLILRQTILMDRSRRENSAEHSWHIALSAIFLSEYAKEETLDFFRVLKMILIHDLVEIDAGDTYCYDDRCRLDQKQREAIAADRIFDILPLDLAQSFRNLWDEFEARATPESKFANALDRFQPFLLNFFTEGQVWKKNKIKPSQVAARMQPIADGSPRLWNYVVELIDEAVRKGFLLPES